MNKHFYPILIIILIANIVIGQTNLRYGQVEPQEKDIIEQISTVEELPLPIALESPIDPDQYILGPGDQLGISIIAADNQMLTIPVGPSGDLLIPSVGVVSIAGFTLEEGIEIIREKILTSYKNAIVDVSLMTIRSFRLQITGAVKEPGFVAITPQDRLTQILEQVSNLNMYGDETNIEIIKNDGSRSVVSLRQYFLTGDLEHNPRFLERDRVIIHYQDKFKQLAPVYTTIEQSPVLITGYVIAAGSYRFMHGYTVLDYISLAGGIRKSGTLENIEIIRKEAMIKLELDDILEPGDVVYIPENRRSVWIGNMSYLQNISAIVSLILTYFAATK